MARVLTGVAGIAVAGVLGAGIWGTTSTQVRTAKDDGPVPTSQATGAGTPGTPVAPASGDQLASPAPTQPTDATTSTVPVPGGATGEPVTIAFAGDISFGGAAGGLLRRDPNTVFGPVASVLSGADLTVANLETAIGSGGTPVPKAFNFQAPASALDAVRAAGIDVVSMANNHGLDYGQSGLTQSLAAIAEKGFPVIGIGRNDTEAFAPWITEVKGQRIAVLTATQVLDAELVSDWTATADHPGLASAKRVDRLVQAVTDARAKADTVIVFLHWGTEKTACPNESQTDLAPKLVAAGADLVIGGHAHRVLGGGFMGKAFVHYGLGNFLFAAHSPDGARSGVLKVTVRGRHVDAYEWIPARINGRDQPVPLSGAEADAAKRYWEGRRPCTGLTATATP